MPPEQRLTETAPDETRLEGWRVVIQRWMDRLAGHERELDHQPNDPITLVRVLGRTYQMRESTYAQMQPHFFAATTARLEQTVAFAVIDKRMAPTTIPNPDHNIDEARSRWGQPVVIRIDGQDYTTTTGLATKLKDLIEQERTIPGRATDPSVDHARDVFQRLRNDGSITLVPAQERAPAAPAQEMHVQYLQHRGGAGHAR